MNSDSVDRARGSHDRLFLSRTFCQQLKSESIDISPEQNADNSRTFMSNQQFAEPHGGGSLVLSWQMRGKTTVILGADAIAASRAFSALDANSSVVVLAKGGLISACAEIIWRQRHGQLQVLDLDDLVPPTSVQPEDSDPKAIETYLDSVKGITLFCITDTLLSVDTARRRSRASASEIYSICNTRNVAVNTADIPDLCDFSFTSTHRFINQETGLPTALQIGVTSNGKGCRLAGRIRREIVAKLPSEVGVAVENVGVMRRMAKFNEVDHCVVEVNEENEPSTPNVPVLSRLGKEADAKRRMRWVAQISEFWPFNKLSVMTEAEMRELLGSMPKVSSQQSDLSQRPSLHSLGLSPTYPTGNIFLLGSGPGHPALLTLAAHNILTRKANLVLSDKLVPAAVLALIPPEVEVRIARKFPGNAEGAQNEMMEAAVEAASRGLTVARLKQGDPMVYGRAGEEVLYFRSRGFETTIIPGVSSALAGPTFAGIPVTQRGVAESFIICTGVGRAGKEVALPGYNRTRTLVILMGIARLAPLLAALVDDEEGDIPRRREGAVYPKNLPVAIVERASMPDQRVIMSTLQNIGVALENSGDQRPPGMLVIGWAVLALRGEGDMSILADGALGGDEDRVLRWLGEEESWRIKDGLEPFWNKEIPSFI